MAPSRVRKRQAGRAENDPKPRKRQRAEGQSNVKVDIDLLQDKNSSAHHTDDYENGVLVLRRGGTFQVEITFSGASFSEVLRTSLRVGIESKISKFDKTSKSCKIVSRLDNSKWNMTIVDKKESQLKIVLEVNIPVTAMIGKYSVEVLIPSSKTSVGQFQFITIFNPWNKDDEVYLSDEKEREEYVLNDQGIIYRGNSYYGASNIGPKYWNFGQFEEHILDCVIELLEQRKGTKKSSLKTLIKERGSVVFVSRILSAVLNSQDEDGVLVGNWSGDYKGGMSPGSWDGSVEILQQYYLTKKPVEYGQCWVFSGIMTTALRALGIPARSVTNFDSAHDTDQTMTIDAFYDEEGNRIEDLCGDSVWNFHVWNEIWTKRKDLPGDRYDGWQAVDATPQEESFQLYQMGPAPLKGVKEGEIYAGFDSGFVFAEVNADRVTWVAEKNDDGEYNVTKMKRRSTRAVGNYISTKKVGKNEREDITHLYKYPEGTPNERKAFDTAYSFGKGPENWSNELNMAEEGDDLTIDLSTNPKEVIEVGKDFKCVVTVKNTSKQKLTLNLCGVINSVTYSDESRTLIKREKMDGISVDAGKSVTREILISAEEYLDKLTEHNTMRFVVVAKVVNTGKQYVDDMNITLETKESSIDAQVVGKFKVGEPAKVVVSFTNPLRTPIRGLKIYLEGAKLTRRLRRTYRRPLQSGATKTATFRFTPRKAGPRVALIHVVCGPNLDYQRGITFNVTEA